MPIRCLIIPCACNFFVFFRRPNPACPHCCCYPTRASNLTNCDRPCDPNSLGRGRPSPTPVPHVSVARKVHRMHQENEGLLAVRKRLRKEVVTLQDEEDKLRRMLGLPPARQELPPPAPAPLPGVPDPLEVARTKKKRAGRNKKQRKATTPPPPTVPSAPAAPTAVLPRASRPTEPTAPTSSAAAPRHAPPPRPSERRTDVEHSSGGTVAASGISGPASTPASGDGGGSDHSGQPTVPTIPTLPAAAPRHAPSPPPTERRPEVERSADGTAAASGIPGSASASARGGGGGGEAHDPATGPPPCSLPVPGSPVSSFDLASGENDDIERLLLGLDDDTPTAGENGSGNNTAPLPPSSPAPRERTLGAEPRPSAGRGRGGRSGRALPDGAAGQKGARGRGRGPLSSSQRDTGLSSAGRGVKKKPNYLDFNAAVKHRPAGRVGGRGAARGRIGNRGGGRGAPVVGAGRGGFGKGPGGIPFGGGSTGGSRGGGGFSPGGSGGGRGGRGVNLMGGQVGSAGEARSIGGGRGNGLMGRAQQQPMGHKETSATSSGVEIAAVKKTSSGAGGNERPPGL